jgi:glycerol-3-phosphate acyltransferase PlsY
VISEVLFLMVLGYLIGSIPVGLLVSRLFKGVDVRDYGSGKTGFTNSLRTIGFWPATLVLLGDVAKGAIPAIIGKVVFDFPLSTAVGGLAAVVGHIFPIFAGFRGGRGVVTSFGVLIVMVPLIGMILAPIGAAIVFLTRYMSLTSIIGTMLGLILLIGLVAVGYADRAYLVYGILVALIILYMHRGNITRLRNGTEPKLGKGGTQRTAGPAAPRT